MAAVDARTGANVTARSAIADDVLHGDRTRERIRRAS
jgi:hypothetical protein